MADTELLNVESFVNEMLNLKIHLNNSLKCVFLDLLESFFSGDIDKDELTEEIKDILEDTSIIAVENKSQYESMEKVIQSILKSDI